MKNSVIWGIVLANLLCLAANLFGQGPAGGQFVPQPSWPGLPEATAPQRAPVPEIVPPAPVAAQDGPGSLSHEEQASPASGFSAFFEGKVNDSASLAWSRFAMVWSYPLTKVDGQAITPGSIACCLLLLWIGYVSARIIAWWFGSRFLPRLGVHPTAIPPLQTICHYVLLGTFTMLSLRLANVPLTAFTFLGGAIAIGIGFGSQTVANNFISGLILLAERPVRVGDTVEVEGQIGKVAKIGPRSTQIQTAANMIVVIPNSKMLEETLINWTLTDDSIRTKIVCGVAYGSRTRDVERWLLEAARGKDEVQQEPAPFVIFADFGDNALVFELHFWISLTEGHNRVEVESELRFEIDDLFRTAGIVMAYPQRDIHLNVMRPVDVRMIGAERNERPASRAA